MLITEACVTPVDIQNVCGVRECVEATSILTVDAVFQQESVVGVWVIHGAVFDATVEGFKASL